MTCTCGKGDEAPAIVHAEYCPCVDWVYGVLEGRVESRGGNMTDEVNFNEEEELREGGVEFEEDSEEEEDGFDEAVESAKKNLSPDEPVLQTPTELAAGGGTADESESLHSSGPSEL